MYLAPCTAPISSSWADHKNRNPPSLEPGTDYGCAYGTPITCADDGVVYAVYGNNNAAGRVVEIRLDDGRAVRYLHLSSSNVNPGKRVTRGQVVAYSGASGYGDDYYYGAHVHTTLLPTWTTPLAQSIDFAEYVGDESPIPEPPIPEDPEEDDMTKMHGANYKRTSDNVTVRLLFNEASGWYSEFQQNDGSYVNPIAQNWETNSWPTITNSHADAIKRDLDKTRNAIAQTSLAYSGWGVAASLIILAIVTVIVNVIPH